ncbi:hypothetical protein Anapl_17420 [Anas platyrhynchos]|uniref:Uncharacterized protein n=1 Tax=Anas platyrhynchos TaxID=8839 RepID=R0JUC3_ANAPL|nr:hypothetical protein Anapl_17420 [Anas platyrhynchos]
MPRQPLMPSLQTSTHKVGARDEQQESKIKETDIPSENPMIADRQVTENMNEPLHHVQLFP